MTGEHLSDLDLDRLRYPVDGQWTDPDELEHLSSCEYCTSRMNKMQDMALQMSQRLDSSLQAARRELSRTKHRNHFRIVYAVSAAAVVAIVIFLGFGYRTRNVGAVKPPVRFDRVRAMGGPHISLSFADGTAVEAVSIGQSFTVRLTGTPRPKGLVVVDVDGSHSVLWCDKTQDSEMEISNKGVEMKIKANKPAGKIAIIAIFGQGPLSEKKALDFARNASFDSGASLPDGWHVIRRSLVVTK